MSIKRNKGIEPKWIDWDYAEKSKHDLFSSRRWKETMDWDTVVEHVKKMGAACSPIDPVNCPPRLLFAYFDILEANLYILDDLFYFLSGVRVGHSQETATVTAAVFRLQFWDMPFYKERDLIYDTLHSIEKHYDECFDLVCSGTYPYKSIARCVYSEKHRAYEFAYAAYESETDKEALLAQSKIIRGFLWNFQMIPCNFDRAMEFVGFHEMLKLYRQSEKGQAYIQPWRRDFEGTRDSLILKMEKDPNLGPWVNKCTHLREDEDPVFQLFCDEQGFVTDKEERCNVDNWLSILTVSAVLLEYDEYQSAKAENEKKPRRNRPIKTFREFVKDPERTEEVVRKLHRLIGNKTNTPALNVITKAVWIGWIEKPTAPSIKNEFPTITCTDQQISKSLREPAPTHKGMINSIIQEFEQA